MVVRIQEINMNFETFHKRSFARTPDLAAFSEPYFFFTHDSSHRVLFVSPSISGILGYSAQELIGKSTSELFDSVSANSYPSQHSRDHALFTISVTSSAGEKVTLEIQTYREINHQGELEAIHGIARRLDAQAAIESDARQRLAKLEVLTNELSDREQQVLSRVLGGRLNKSIAKELEISERAVERIRARIMKKLRADSTAQMISMASEYKLLNELLNPTEQNVCPSPLSSKNNGAKTGIV